MSTTTPAAGAIVPDDQSPIPPIADLQHQDTLAAVGSRGGFLDQPNEASDLLAVRAAAAVLGSLSAIAQGTVRDLEAIDADPDLSPAGKQKRRAMVEAETRQLLDKLDLERQERVLTDEVALGERNLRAAIERHEQELPDGDKVLAAGLIPNILALPIVERTALLETASRDGDVNLLRAFFKAPRALLTTPIAGEPTDVAKVEDLGERLDQARTVFIRRILPRQARDVGEVAHARKVMVEAIAGIAHDVDRIGAGTLRRPDAFQTLALGRAANRRRKALGLPLLDIAKGRDAGRQGPREDTRRRI